MKELVLEAEVVETKSLPVVRETVNPIEISDSIKKRITELRSMGFTTAAKKAESAHKMVLAYGEYTFITTDTIHKFNEALKKETLQEDKRAYRYKKMVFIPIEKYDKVPPSHVIEAMERARRREIFDRFEIGKIDWIEEIKDPIVFGRIDGCTDYFYIAQWDNDVKIEDLLDL